MTGSAASYLRSLFSLEGQVALVTGGSSGIGRGIAHALASAGAAVVILARREDALAATVADLTAAGHQAAWVSADLAVTAELERAAEAACQPFGEPTVLVNSAGVNPRPPLGSLTRPEWDQILAVNLTAPFLLGQRFGPVMAERHWGRIVNIASQQAFRAFGNSGGYGAAKAGLAGLTRSQAEAWSATGVCCNALIPGFVPTPMTAAALAEPGRAEALAARTMMGRSGTPEDFAGAAVFLASRASGYVTGQMIFVDGGFSVT